MKITVYLIHHQSYRDFVTTKDLIPIRIKQHFEENYGYEGGVIVRKPDWNGQMKFAVLFETREDYNYYVKEITSELTEEGVIGMLREALETVG